MLNFDITEGNIEELKNATLRNNENKRIIIVTLYSFSALIAIALFAVGTILSATYIPTHDFFDLSRGTENKTTYIFYYISLLLGVTALIFSKFKPIKLFKSIIATFIVISLVSLSPILNSGSIKPNDTAEWLNTEYGLTSTTDLKSFSEPLLMQNSEGETMNVTFERQGSFLSLTKMKKTN